MAAAINLDNPYHLARALEPWARGYLANFQATFARFPSIGQVGFKEGNALATKTRYDQVRELNPSDPLRLALMRWLHRATEMRVNTPWLEADERMYRQTLHLVKEPSEHRLSLYEMQMRSLGCEGQEASVWLSNVELCGRELSEHRTEYLHRCTEVHARLGEVDVLQYWSPVSSLVSLSVLLAPGLGSLRGMLDECQVRTPLQLIELGRGAAQNEGWPARLAPDTLSELFAAPELFRGVSIEPGVLPARLCPASFLRAAYQVAWALHLAYCPQDRPFLALRDPDGRAGHQLGYLCVLWFLSRHFDEKVLNLGKSKSRERRRGAAQLLLALLSTSALRLQIAERGLDHRVTPDELADLGRSTFSSDFQLDSPLAMLSIRRDQVARWAGLLSAAHNYQQFVDEFDEDWFLNPRALEKLRAEHSTADAPQCDEQILRSGLSILQEQIVAGLT